MIQCTSYMVNDWPVTTAMQSPVMVAKREGPQHLSPQALTTSQLPLIPSHVRSWIADRFQGQRDMGYYPFSGLK